MSAEIDNAKNSGDDPKEWARQFIKLYSWLGEEIVKEHILVQWFSAAIEIGKNVERKSHETESVRNSSL